MRYFIDSICMKCGMEGLMFVDDDHSQGEPKYLSGNCDCGAVRRYNRLGLDGAAVVWEEVVYG